LPSPTLLCVRCRGRFVPIDRRTNCSGCLRPLPAGSAGVPRCGACLTDPHSIPSLFAVWRYQRPLSEAILALKFRRLDFLADSLAELALEREPFRAGAEYDLVVPVPLAPPRRLSRGFNQAERIARRIGQRIGLPVRDLLRRSDLLPTAQIRLGRAARRALTPAHRYRVCDRSELSGARILLVDDVVTTGSTLRASARALIDAGAGPVDAFALAATPAPDWLLATP
jgi:ComF family protein